MKLTKKQELFRREYARGLIDGSKNPLKKGYSVQTLWRRYRQYLKDNPTAKEDIASPSLS